MWTIVLLADNKGTSVFGGFWFGPCLTFVIKVNFQKELVFILVVGE
jgi:hypothetical protein